jgi:transcriptional regulator with XRE-family HTH domain
MAKKDNNKPIIGDLSEWKFTEYVNHHRLARNWTYAELSRRCNLSEPEVCRAETGQRQPTLRVVCELARALSQTPHSKDDCSGYAEWLVRLSGLGESARIQKRQAQPRAARR